MKPENFFLRSILGKSSKWKEVRIAVIVVNHLTLSVSSSLIYTSSSQPVAETHATALKQNTVSIFWQIEKVRLTNGAVT